MDTSRATVRIFPENVQWNDVRPVFLENVPHLDDIQFVDSSKIAERSSVSIEYTVSKTLPLPSNSAYGSVSPWNDPYVYAVLFKCPNSKAYKDGGVRKRLTDLAEALKVAQRSHIFVFVPEIDDKEKEKDQRKIFDKLKADLPVGTKISRLDDIPSLIAVMRSSLAQSFAERIQSLEIEATKSLVSSNTVGGGIDVFRYILVVDALAISYTQFRLFVHANKMYADLFKFVETHKSIFKSPSQLSLESISTRIFDVLQKPYRDMIESREITAFEVHEYIVSRQIAVLNFSLDWLEAANTGKKFIRYYLAAWHDDPQMLLRSHVWGFCAFSSLAEIIRVWIEGRGLPEGHPLFDAATEILNLSRTELLRLGAARGFLPELSLFDIVSCDRFHQYRDPDLSITDGDIAEIRYRDLFNALLSVQAFDTLLMSTSAQIITAFQIRARPRWVAEVNDDLAYVRMCRSDFDESYLILKQESFLLRSDSWVDLLARCLPLLAYCQEKLGHLDECLISLLEMCALESWSEDVRKQLFLKALAILDSYRSQQKPRLQNASINPSAAGMLAVSLRNVIFVTAKVSSSLAKSPHSPVVTVSITSHFPMPVSVSSVTLSCTRSPLNQRSVRRRVLDPGSSPFSPKNADPFDEVVEFHHESVTLHPFCKCELQFALLCCPLGWYETDRLVFFLDDFGIYNWTSLAGAALDIPVKQSPLTVSASLDHPSCLVPNWPQEIQLRLHGMLDDVVEGRISVTSSTGLQFCSDALDVAEKLSTDSWQKSFTKLPSDPPSSLLYPLVVQSCAVPSTVLHSVSVQVDYRSSSGQRFSTSQEFSLSFRSPFRARGRFIVSHASDGDANLLQCSIINDSDSVFCVSKCECLVHDTATGLQVSEISTSICNAGPAAVRPSETLFEILLVDAKTVEALLPFTERSISMRLHFTDGGCQPSSLSVPSVLDIPMDPDMSECPRTATSTTATTSCFLTVTCLSSNIRYADLVTFEVACDLIASDLSTDRAVPSVIELFAEDSTWLLVGNTVTMVEWAATTPFSFQFSAIPLCSGDVVAPRAMLRPISTSLEVARKVHHASHHHPTGHSSLSAFPASAHAHVKVQPSSLVSLGLVPTEAVSTLSIST
eukprot:ANDGO_05717.mRNA.1 hypothetical protein